MSRAVDRGANVAAVVGIGMALTIAVSFLMVIPIDPAYLILAPLSGLLIGWYGNQRAEQVRSRPGRVLANAAWSGGVTAVTFAALFLGVKLFFFSLDPGYRDERSGGSFTCAAGPACVYERYLAADGGEAALAEAGINIEIISTSSIRVSCVVPAREAERAVNVIHERLRLADDVLYEGAA